MSKLNSSGQEVVSKSAASHGFSDDAVRHMLEALSRGYGTQAQFNHPEFGGMGQWSQGGMTMIGDMFNNGLKARVDSLCADLSGAMAGQVLFDAPATPPGVSWSYSAAQSGSVSGWPAELGHPASQGAQNDLRYAFFPQTRRLAIARGGSVTVYDTGDHQISGFGQAQGADQTLSFTSQYGLVPVSSLPVVDLAAPATEQSAPTLEHEAETLPEPEPRPEATAPMLSSAEASGLSDDQIFSRLEKLADLRDRGIVSDEEFAAKKAELLARL